VNPYQVSASIVAYENSSSELVAAIRSVVGSGLRVTCTVVDNSASPSLRDCVVSAGAEYVKARTNLGFGAGHNLALQSHIESSEFCLILNPDVEFSPDVLGTLYDFMLKHEEVGLVMPKILYRDGSDQRLCRRLPAPHDLIIRRFLGRAGRGIFKRQLMKYELSDIDLSKAWEVPCLSGCFMLARSSVLKEVGTFDERYFMYMEDFDLCRRIGRHAKTVYYPHVSVKHGYAKGSYANPKLLRHHVCSSIRYFVKWGWYSDRERRTLNQRVVPYRLDKE
jgi:GT2 family glycosyltransferase